MTPATADLPGLQGNDAGTQYRSVIYYYDDAQKEAAEKVGVA